MVIKGFELVMKGYELVMKGFELVIVSMEVIKVWTEVMKVHYEFGSNKIPFWQWKFVMTQNDMIWCEMTQYIDVKWRDMTRNTWYDEKKMTWYDAIQKHGEIAKNSKSAEQTHPVAHYYTDVISDY